MDQKAVGEQNAPPALRWLLCPVEQLSEACFPTQAMPRKTKPHNGNPTQAEPSQAKPS